MMNKTLVGFSAGMLFLAFITFEIGNEEAAKLIAMIGSAVGLYECISWGSNLVASKFFSFDAKIRRESKRTLSRYDKLCKKEENKFRLSLIRAENTVYQTDKILLILQRQSAFKVLTDNVLDEYKKDRDKKRVIEKIKDFEDNFVVDLQKIDENII